MNPINLPIPSWRWNHILSALPVSCSTVLSELPDGTCCNLPHKYRHAHINTWDSLSHRDVRNSIQAYYSYSSCCVQNVVHSIEFFSTEYPDDLWHLPKYPQQRITYSAMQCSWLDLLFPVLASLFGFIIWFHCQKLHFVKQNVCKLNCKYIII